MDKKPLIVVCICAVMLLVLGSLSNVVGYQSVKSSVNASPLFTTRTQRATNHRQNNITFLYVGKGKASNLFLSQRPDKTGLLSAIINRIQSMDEDSFNQFVKYIIIQIHNQDNLKNYNTKELINELYNLRKITGITIITRDINNNNRTILNHYVPTYCWFPGCYIYAAFWFILLTIYFTIAKWRSVNLLSYCFCP